MSRLDVIRKSVVVLDSIPDKTVAQTQLVSDFKHLLEIIDLMAPVVEYVSRGRGYVGVGVYPDAVARAAMGKQGD